MERCLWQLIIGKSKIQIIKIFTDIWQAKKIGTTLHQFWLMRRWYPEPHMRVYLGKYKCSNAIRRAPSTILWAISTTFNHSIGTWTRAEHELILLGRRQWSSYVLRSVVPPSAASFPKQSICALNILGSFLYFFFMFSGVEMH